MAEEEKKEEIKKEKPKKIRILVHADSPAVATGFSRVTDGIFTNLAKTGKYDITIFGVNDSGGWQDPEKYPYKIYPAMLAGVQGDFYGRIRFINAVRGADLWIKPSWDIIFTLNDPFIFEEPVLTPEIGLMDALKDLRQLYREQIDPKHWFSLISYWPVDSSLKENWIEHAVALPDVSVAYTQYGKREIDKANQKLEKPFSLDISVIYHGVDSSHFYPVDDAAKREFKEKFFKKARIDFEHTFIVGVVARNQMRKDIPRAMKIFKEFQKRRPDSLLYIHAKENDSWGSLNEYARQFNLELGKDWIFPGKFSENQGYPVEALNLIYNSMDVNLMTSHGEGFGLPIIESMATKTLNIAPNITSIPELFNTENKNFDDPSELANDDSIRGIPVKAMSTSSEWVTYGPTDYERIRPLVNVDDAVKKLLWVYDHPEEAAKIAQRAYDWVQQYSWKNIADQWDQVFTKVYNELETERSTPRPKKDESTTDTNNTDQPQPLESKRDGARPVQQTEGEHQADETVSVPDSAGTAGQ